MRDFRRLPDGDPDHPDLPSKLRLTLRRVEQQRDLAVELSERGDRFDTQKIGPVPEDSEQFGQLIRGWLDVTQEEQRTGASPTPH